MGILIEERLMGYCCANVWGYATHTATISPSVFRTSKQILVNWQVTRHKIAVTPGLSLNRADGEEYIWKKYCIVHLTSPKSVFFSTRRGAVVYLFNKHWEYCFPAAITKSHHRQAL